jgi:hypothetical protein
MLEISLESWWLRMHQTTSRGDHIVLARHPHAKPFMAGQVPLVASARHNRNTRYNLTGVGSE